MSVQTRVSYKTLMCSASCIYVVMNMNLNRQCLRHTNQTTAWSKGMPEYYWTYNFGYQLWRLICMPLPFFSSFVPIPHCKCQRKVSSLLFHWSKDTSPWTTEKENDECCESVYLFDTWKRRGLEVVHTTPGPVSSFSNFTLIPRSALCFSFHKSHSQPEWTLKGFICCSITMIYPPETTFLTYLDSTWQHD